MGVEIRQVADPIYANARGAAWIGAVGMGEISFADVPALVQFKHIYTPDEKNQALYNERFAVFTQIYRQMKSVYKLLNS
jgi:xylulokinase